MRIFKFESVKSTGYLFWILFLIFYLLILAPHPVLAQVKPVKTISVPTTIVGQQFWSSDYDYIIEKEIIISGTSSFLNIEAGAKITIANGAYFEISKGATLNIGVKKEGELIGDMFSNLNNFPDKIFSTSSIDSLLNLGASGAGAQSEIYLTDSSYDPFSVYSGGKINIRKVKINCLSANFYRDIFGIYGGASKINVVDSVIDGFNDYSQAVFVDTGRLLLYNTKISNYKGRSFVVASNSAGINILNSAFSNLYTNNAINLFTGSSLLFFKSSISTYKFNSTNSSSGTCISGFDKTIINVSSSNIKNCSIGFSFFGAGTFEIHKNNIIDNNISVQNYSKKLNGQDNWWGSVDGANPTTEEDSILNGYENGFTSETNLVPFAMAPFGDDIKCCSSVLFIPGIQGSRLYKKGLWGTENQLWEPNRNTDTKSLFLDSGGKPLFNNIYTRDVITKTNILGPVGSLDIYQGLIDFMSNKKTEGIISDFQVLPYDWRMSPSYLLSSGIKREKDFVYIKDKIMKMASSSPTGQVIILSHSYGGILAKYIAKELDKVGAGGKIESIIMVSTPEFGTPQSITSTLYGDRQDLLFGLILSKETVVGLVKNMISAYMLFPGVKYFEGLKGLMGQSDLMAESLITLDRWSMSKLGVSSGAIDSSEKFNLLVNKLGVLNSNLFNFSKTEHNYIDDFPLALASKTYSIVGVGMPTLSGINFVKPKCRGLIFCSYGEIPDFERKFSLIGDGVVFAHNLSERTGSVFTVDIGAENEANKGSLNFFITGGIAHKDIFRSDGVKELVSAIVGRNKMALGGNGLGGTNSFESMTNKNISFISELSDKPSPFHTIYENTSFLKIPIVVPLSVSASLSDRLGTSKILIAEAYGPVVLKANFKEENISNKPISELSLSDKIINKMEYSDGNRSGVVSVVDCKKTDCGSVDLYNKMIYGIGGGVGTAQIITKIDNVETVYPNISVTPSTNIDINYSTTTISIDNNNDGVTDKIVDPIQINSSSTEPEDIDVLFKKARERLEVFSQAASTTLTSSTSTNAYSDSYKYLTSKYIDKINVAERRYLKFSLPQSIDFLNLTYKTLESNMLIISNKINVYNKEQQYYGLRKFLSSNQKVMFVDRRRAEIRNEILVYTEIHDVLAELMKGLAKNL